ncbi:MAG: hypothetical protein JJV97_06285, partial [SAR324 cluster bacterium]|nr:hypothetical protein [SAR324 cluster bacterium]
GDVFTNQASESLSNLNLPKLHGLVVNGDFIYAAALDHSIIKLPKTANHDQQITKLDSLFAGSGSSSEAGKVDLSSANFPVSFGDILPADIKLNYVTKLLASKNYLYAYDFLNHSIRKISLNLDANNKRSVANISLGLPTGSPVIIEDVLYIPAGGDIYKVTNPDQALPNAQGIITPTLHIDHNQNYYGDIAGFSNYLIVFNGKFQLIDQNGAEPIKLIDDSSQAVLALDVQNNHLQNSLSKFSQHPLNGLFYTQDYLTGQVIQLTPLVAQQLLDDDSGGADSGDDTGDGAADVDTGGTDTVDDNAGGDSGGDTDDAANNGDDPIDDFESDSISLPPESNILAFKVSLVSGSTSGSIPADSSSTATLSSARYNNLQRITFNGDSIYVTERTGMVKKINTILGDVTVFAGSGLEKDIFSEDSTSHQLNNLNLPNLSAIHSHGKYLYLSALNHSILKLPVSIDANSELSLSDNLFAGDGILIENGKPDISANYPITQGALLPASIRLNAVTDISSTSQNIYALDSLNKTVRRISTSLDSNGERMITNIALGQDINSISISGNKLYLISKGNIYRLLEPDQALAADNGVITPDLFIDKSQNFQGDIIDFGNYLLAFADHKFWWISNKSIKAIDIINGDNKNKPSINNTTNTIIDTAGNLSFDKNTQTFYTIDMKHGQVLQLTPTFYLPMIRELGVSLFSGESAGNAPSDYQSFVSISDARYDDLLHLELNESIIYSAEFDGRIKKIDVANDKVTLLAGSSQNGDVFPADSDNTTLADVNLYNLTSFTIQGNYIYASVLNHSIVKLPKDAPYDQQISREDTLFAGSGNSADLGQGDLDSSNYPASFGDLLPAQIKLNNPKDIASTANNLFVLDSENNTVRRISLSLNDDGTRSVANIVLPHTHAITGITINNNSLNLVSNGNIYLLRRPDAAEAGQTNGLIYASLLHDHHQSYNGDLASYFNYLVAYGSNKFWWTSRHGSTKIKITQVDGSNIPNLNDPTDELRDINLKFIHNEIDNVFYTINPANGLIIKLVPKFVNKMIGGKLKYFSGHLQNKDINRIKQTTSIANARYYGGDVTLAFDGLDTIYLANNGLIRKIEIKNNRVTHLAGSKLNTQSLPIFPRNSIAAGELALNTYTYIYFDNKGPSQNLLYINTAASSILQLSPNINKYTTINKSTSYFGSGINNNISRTSDNPTNPLYYELYQGIPLTYGNIRSYQLKGDGKIAASDHRYLYYTDRINKTLRRISRLGSYMTQHNIRCLDYNNPVLVSAALLMNDDNRPTLYIAGAIRSSSSSMKMCRLYNPHKAAASSNGIIGSTPFTTTRSLVGVTLSQYANYILAISPNTQAIIDRYGNMDNLFIEYGEGQTFLKQIGAVRYNKMRAPYSFIYDEERNIFYVYQLVTNSTGWYRIITTLTPTYAESE